MQARPAKAISRWLTFAYYVVIITDWFPLLGVTLATHSVFFVAEFFGLLLVTLPWYELVVHTVKTVWCLQARHTCTVGERLYHGGCTVLVAVLLLVSVARMPYVSLILAPVVAQLWGGVLSCSVGDLVRRGGAEAGVPYAL